MSYLVANSQKTGFFMMWLNCSYLVTVSRSDKVFPKVLSWISFCFNCSFKLSISCLEYKQDIFLVMQHLTFSGNIRKKKNKMLHIGFPLL